LRIESRLRYLNLNPPRIIKLEQFLIKRNHAVAVIPAREPGSSWCTTRIPISPGPRIKSGVTMKGVLYVRKLR